MAIDAQYALEFLGDAAIVTVDGQAVERLDLAVEVGGVVYGAISGGRREFRLEDDDECEGAARTVPGCRPPP